MLTITKKPDSLSFAGNPIKYLVHSMNFVSNPGIFSVFTFRVDGIDSTNNHTFKLSFNGKDYVFFLSNRLDDDPLRINPAIAEEDDFSTWAQTIYRAFILNYDFITNFSINLQGATSHYRDIVFTSLVKDPIFNITLTVMNTAGIHSGPVTAGVAPIARSNFGILMRLCQDTGAEIGEDFKAVDSLGNVTFEISEYLLSSISKMEQLDPVRFMFPETSALNYNVYRNYVQSYIAAFSEKYDDFISKLQLDDTRHAIGGGLNRETIISYSANNLVFFNVDAVKKSFLTQAPLTKKTGIEVPEKLFFLFQEDKLIPSFIIMLKCECSNNSGWEFDITGGRPVVLSNYTVYELMVGYGHLKLANKVAGTSVLAWSIWLATAQGVPITEMRRFELDPKYQEFPRVFMFRNSLSAYDVVRFTGVREAEIDNDPIINSRSNSEEDYTIRNAPVIKLSSFETQSFKINSGWVSMETKDYLRDFLLSPEVYEVIGDDLIPTVITSKKTPLFKDRENGMISFECECQRAFTDNYYSKIYKPAKWKDPEVWTDSGTWSDTEKKNE